MDISELSKSEAHHLIKFHGDDLFAGEIAAIIENHHDALDDGELGVAVHKWSRSRGACADEIGKKLRRLIIGRL